MPIDANKVAEEAYSAGNLVTNDGYYEFDLEAAATVIQSAFAEELAGMEAEITALRDQLAKAEGALRPFAEIDLTDEELGSDFAWNVLRARAYFAAQEPTP